MFSSAGIHEAFKGFLGSPWELPDDQYFPSVLLLLSAQKVLPMRTFLDLAREPRKSQKEGQEVP